MQVDKHKESLNLFIGGSSSESSLDLFLDNPKGLLHSNNIDFRNSISKTQSIKFESEFASSVLDFSPTNFSGNRLINQYKWSAQKIKIIDDYALVSYPDYTDINKNQTTYEKGGLYRPFAAFRNVIINSGGNGQEQIDPNNPPLGDGPIVDNPGGPPTEINDPNDPPSSGGFSGCPTDFSLYEPMSNIVVLPDLPVPETNYNYEFENLFIVVEYDGWTTDSNGNIVNTALTNGLFEVFEYDFRLTKPSTWAYYSPTSSPRDPFNDLKFPMLRSKYIPLAACPELIDSPFEYDPITSTRLLEDRVINNDGPKLDDIIRGFEFRNPSNCVRLGFIGYSKIHYIKYTPVVKCGRVDLYERKHGVITSYSDVYISPSHKLATGDVVEIVSSNGQDPSIACGTRYVQVRNSNSFFLYEDPDFTKKIEDINIRFAVYNCIGNVYDNNDNGWKYRQSIFSPTGLNGECGPVETLTPSETSNYKPLPKLFNSCKTYRDILLKDILNDFPISKNESLLLIPDSFYNINRPKLPITSTSISAGFNYWVSHFDFVNSYRFGSDIDFIKQNDNTYYFLIGERGSDRWVPTEKKYFRHNQPHGRCHLFSIISNNINYVSTLTASSFNTEIPSVVTGVPSFNNTNIYLSFSNVFDNDYWFGSMLMGRESILFNNDEDINYSVKQYNYSSDMPDPTVNMLFYIPGFDPGFSRVDARFYPYVDSFGKSVALTFINGELVIAASSNTKTFLQHPSLRQKDWNDTSSIVQNYDFSYNYNTIFGGIDFGYIHLFSYFAQTNTRLKVPVNSDIFSKSFWAQKYTCENFAKCMIFDGPILYFGEPRSPDVTAESNPLIPLNRSKIHSIRVSQNVSLTPLVFNTIQNPFNEQLYYNSSDATQSFPIGATINNKTRLIKSELSEYSSPLDFYSSERVYISDDFGANFIVSPKFIATNAYSLINNLGLPVSVITDYVNIIDKNTNSTINRISPSINKELAVYDFESTIGLDYPASFVEIGNTHYQNSAINSVTWDTKLNNCYVILDDTLILKDPIGYAFFDTNTWICVESVVSPQRANFITSDGSVRSTDTGRISYNNPIITYGTSRAKYYTDDFSTVDSWAILSFETSSFTNGTYSAFYSSDFGTSFDISRDDFLSIFMPVVDFQSAPFPGYIFGASIDNEQINFFINAELSDSKSIDFFVGPVEINSNLNIFVPYVTQRIADSNLSLNIVNGNDLWSDQITVFLKTVDDFRALDLVLFPPLQFSGAIDLSIDPPFPLDNDLTLFTNGTLYSNNFLDLQLENFPDNQVRQALLIQLNPDPININSSNDLFIFGTTIPGSSYLESGFNIFMDSLQGSSGDLNLNLAVSNTGSIDDILLLKIHNEMESGSYSESLVFSMEPFGSNVFFTPSSGIRNLSIKGADILQDSVPLFIKKSGLEGEESIDTINFFLHNTIVSSGVDIIMDCNLVESGLINLSFSQTVGLESRNLNVFTRGFEE